MKKLAALALVSGLIMVSLLPSAGAAAPKTVKTTLYLHGNTPVGEGAEAAVNLSDGLEMKLDTTPPTDPAPKSYNFNNPVGNDKCSGNSTFFPTWNGDLAGTIVGDVTWTAHFVSPPSQVIARIWTDTPISSCNESYIEPAKEVIVDIPAGRNAVDIVFPKLKLKAGANIMVELLQRSPSKQGRVLYDATGFESALTFNCIPPKGAKTCAP
jgi:hypothetical protein